MRTDWLCAGRLTADWPFEDCRDGKSHFAGSMGDAINTVLAAVGNNFRRILTWL